METPNRTPLQRADRAELAISLAILALGAFVVAQTFAIDAEGGYSAVGPRFSPLLVAIGLAAGGALLLREALTGGWRGMQSIAPGERFEAIPFALIAGALLVHLAVIGTVGFTLASTFLFAVTARAMGGRRWGRNVAIGFALALAVFLVFTRVLKLALPALVKGVL